MLKDKDSKQSIQVTIRVRPLSDKQLNQDSRICVKFQQANSLHLYNNNQTKKFTFDSICFNQSQQEIFNRVGKKCTSDCLEGYNCTIFAYGQTGAGKTYTMMGISFENERYYEHRGLIPRTMEYLFDCIERQRQNGVNFIIRCSFLQIYNEQIIDLLNKANNNLQLRQDTRKGVYVQGITEEIISKSDEAMQILYKGSKSRHVGSTFYNQTSSRSHSVFTMQIQSRYSKNGVVNTKSRQFNFIDLAGSERTKQSTGERLKQGCNINKSLMNLAAVINALSEVSEGKIQHVNYRNSKLTFLLKDSLGGNSKTNLIANISPGTIFYQQTLSTLGFARRAKLIKREKASINQDSSGNIESMKNEIKRLKQEVITLMSRSQMPSDESDPQTHGNPPTEMTSMMHQYVQQQIDKQTKLQLQLLKLNDRILHLQKGIKQYSSNQIQLRMIITIYEDKINRLKNIEKMLMSKIDDLSQSDQESRNIVQYFKNQRMSLIKQVEIFKKQTENTKFLKELLKEAKIMKDENQDDSLKELLARNTNFLNVIHEKLDLMKPEKLQIQFSTQFQKKITAISAQFSKKQQQYLERLQQFNLQQNEYKTRSQQNEKLLEQAISGHLILEQKLKDQVNKNEKSTLNLQKNKKQITRLSEVIKQNKMKYQSNINQIKSALQDKQMNLSMLKNDNQSLKIKLQKASINDKIFKEQFQNLQEEKYKIEKMMMVNIQELKELKNNGLKFQSQIVVFNQRIQALQNQKIILKEQSARISNILVQKEALFEVKYAELQALHQNQCSKHQNKLQELMNKYNILEETQKNMKTNLLKKDQQLENINTTLKKNQNEHKQEINGLNDKNKELMHLINQKKLTDNQIRTKLNNLKLQIIQLNSQKQSMEHKYKINLQDLTQKLNKENNLSQNMKRQLQQKSNKNGQLLAEFNIKSKQIYQLQENNIKLNHNLGNIREQLESGHQKVKQYEKQVQSLKEKEKEFKINIINLKNELFVSGKNLEIQLEAYKSQVILKNQLIEQLQKENLKNKTKYEKNVSDIQKQLDTNKQLFENHEESMKKSMEHHLLSKEKKIQEIKILLQQSETKLKEKEQTLASLNSKIEDFETLRINQEKDLTTVNQINQQKQKKIQMMIAQLNEMKEKYEKQIQQNQIIHGEQLDQKNQKIQLYIIQNQSHLTALEKIKSQNQSIKQQNQMIKSQISSLHHQVQSQDIEKIQIHQKVDQLTRSREENQLKQQQLTTKFYQATLQLQKYQKEFQIYRQKKQNEINKFQCNQNLSLKQINQATQALNKELQQSKHSYIAQIQKTYSLSVQIQSCRTIIQQEKLINIGNQKKMTDIVHENKKILEEFNQLKEQIVQKQERCVQLTNVLNQYRMENEIQVSIIKELKMSLENESMSRTKQIQKNTLYEYNIKQKESHINSLQTQLSRHQQEIKELFENEQTMKKQIQQIILKYKSEQQEANQYKLINKSLELLLSDKQNIINNYKSQEKKSKVYLQQLHLKHQKQIDKNNLQLNFYIQEGKKFTQQIINQENVLHRINGQNQHLKMAQINNQEILAKMNASIQQKIQKYQVLMNQTTKLRKNYQEEQVSKENIYKQLCNERQVINNLKMLIDNKSAQNQQLEHQLQEKDSIYKKLVEKIAKNENQNKKATNSEHYLRTIQLLEKSRAEQIELRRQNQQCRKVISSMKETIEQKEANSKEIQKKSQNYCISMHKRMEQIQNDYIELQRKQQKILKEKKNLQRYASQNDQLKQQMKSMKGNMLKSIQRYEQLQGKLKKSNLDYIQLQRQFQEFKKGQMMTFNNTDDKTTYINRLKAQVAALKTQKVLLTDTLNKERQEKTKLKADIRYGKDTNSQNNSKVQLEKKIHENKNLQELIFQIVSHLKICVNEPKTKLQAIRSIILGTIKEKNSQIKGLRQKIKDLQVQMQRNGSSKPEYAVYREKNRQIKALSISNANRNTLNNEQHLRFQKQKDPSFLSNNSRQKIKEFQNHYARLGQNDDNFRNKIN